MREKNEFFAQAAEEDQDELLDELNELEAEEIEKEFAAPAASHNPIHAPAAAVDQQIAPAAPAQPAAKASQDDADMLAQMMA